jgi:DNA-binding NtrC family response regulator
MHHQSGIIIVDDEPLIAMLLEDLLGDLGYKVEGSAYSEAQAFELLSQSRPQAAILDVHLGMATSFALASACEEKGIAVIYTTGDEHGWMAKLCKQSPILDKPFSREDLVAALEQVAVVSRSFLRIVP